jgi:hypothetical protein
MMPLAGRLLIRGQPPLEEAINSFTDDISGKRFH